MSEIHLDVQPLCDHVTGVAVNFLKISGLLIKGVSGHHVLPFYIICCHEFHSFRSKVNDFGKGDRDCQFVRDLLEEHRIHLRSEADSHLVFG